MDTSYSPVDRVDVPPTWARNPAQEYSGRAPDDAAPDGIDQLRLAVVDWTRCYDLWVRSDRPARDYIERELHRCIQRVAELEDAMRERIALASALYPGAEPILVPSTITPDEVDRIVPDIDSARYQGDQAGLEL